MNGRKTMNKLCFDDNGELICQVDITDDILREARAYYRAIFLEADKKYQKAKREYVAICDFIYDRENYGREIN